MGRFSIPDPAAEWDDYCESFEGRGFECPSCGFRADELELCRGSEVMCSYGKHDTPRQFCADCAPKDEEDGEYRCEDCQAEIGNAIDEREDILFWCSTAEGEKEIAYYRTEVI